MELQTLIANKRQDVSLGSLKGGAVFRFAHIREVDAISEKAFYMVGTDPHKASEGTVPIINVSNGEFLIRDKGHRVVKYSAAIGIEES